MTVSLRAQSRPSGLTTAKVWPCRCPSKGIFMSRSKELFALSTHVAPEVRGLLASVGWTPEDVDHYAFHQPSQAVLERIFSDLNAKPDAGIHTHSLYGNSASTAWALALDHRLRNGTVADGDKIVIGSAAAGFTMAAAAAQGCVELPRYLVLYRTINKTFGFRLRPLGTFVVLQLRQAISALTMALDGVFFSGWRTEPIDRPIFIVGNPRSGTTFPHRLLLGAGDTAAFELFEMLFRPSQRASCSPASFPASTGSPLRGITPPISTTRTFGESRPMMCCGSSAPWTVRSLGRISFRGRTAGAVVYAGVKWASRASPTATASASSATTSNAGAGTCSIRTPNASWLRPGC